MRRCSLILVVTSLIAGCAGSSDYKAPGSFTVSDSAVADVAESAVNNTSGSPGMRGSASANCSGERSCNIRYTVKQPAGISTGTELVDPTRQIWKAMFEDSQFQHGTITVEGPVTSVGGKNSNAPLFTPACNRSAASQIDRGNVDSHGIETLCTYIKLVNGI